MGNETFDFDKVKDKISTIKCPLFEIFRRASRRIDKQGFLISSKLEAVGAKFRRDVILSDKIKATKSSINKIKTAMDGLNTGGEDKAIQEALDQLINNYKQKVKEYKKQQNNITNKYGK